MECLDWNHGLETFADVLRRHSLFAFQQSAEQRIMKAASLGAAAASHRKDNSRGQLRGTSDVWVKPLCS